MPDVFDLTQQYRTQLIAREDQARLAMLKDYRGVWNGLEKKLDRTIERTAFSTSETEELAAAFKDDLALAGEEGPAELSADKLEKFTGLLMKKRSWQELETELDKSFGAVAENAAQATDRQRGALGLLAVDHALQLMRVQLRQRTQTSSQDALAELDKSTREAVEQMWREQRDDLSTIFAAKAAEVAERARTALRQEVLHGILTGVGGEQILGRVRQAIDERNDDPTRDPSLVRALRAEYRVATQNSYRETLRLTYSESGKVSQWRWTSARTPQTCALCWAMDGKIFPLETPLKSHPHCRCVPVPIVDGEDDEGDSADAAGTTEREGGELGEFAFAGLAPEQQRAILGGKAFEAYTQGEFDLSDLIGVQFNTRFGVTLYRQSLDRATDKARRKFPVELLEAAATVGPDDEEINPFSGSGIGGVTEIQQENLVAANFSGDRLSSLFGGTSDNRQGADTFDDSSGFSLAGLSFSNGNSSLGGDKNRKPKFRLYPEGSGVDLAVQKGQTQLEFFKRALNAHGWNAGLRGTDLADFVKYWTDGEDPDKFEMIYSGTTNKVGSAFKVGKTFRYIITKDILEDLHTRQKDAYAKGRWRNLKATSEAETQTSGSGGSSDKNKGSGNTEKKPSSTVPGTLTQKDADELLDSLPVIGSGDGSFIVSFPKVYDTPPKDLNILAYFIQQHFGGEMWGQDSLDYAEMAIQEGVEMRVITRDDDSDPRSYKIQFDAGDLRILSKLRLEWQQEYAHRVIATAESREEVNQMFLDFLRVYPNLAIEFVEQIANIPIDVLNELGHPLDLIPLLGPGYKNARLVLSLLGYDAPDFKLFEIPRISFDGAKLKYKSKMWQRDGEKIEQGTLFVINLILLKKMIVGKPVGPLENPLGLKNAPKLPIEPVVPKTEPEPIPKPKTEPFPKTEPEPIPKPKSETLPEAKPETPGGKTPNQTPKTQAPKTQAPKTSQPKTPKTPKQKTVETPEKPQAPKKPQTKSTPKPETTEPVKPQKPVETKPVEKGYEGEWPPKAPEGKKPNINTEEGANWRYQRYLREQYKAGKKPGEVLSRETWERSKLEPARNGGRPGRRGGEDQVSTREKLVENEGFTNTESTQLGSRLDKIKGQWKRVKNMVDSVRRNRTGGLDYVEVDEMTKGGLPRSGMRWKLKNELQYLKPGETLTYVDKKNPASRIIYQYGEKQSVVDTRTATIAP